jgi:hypothetical protein
MKLFVTAHVVGPLALVLLVAGPLYYNDYPLMIYFQHRALQFFGAFQNLWGYDPYYSAGYPLNFTWNSNLVLQFLQVLLYPIPEYAVLLISTFASIAIAPLMFWLGLGNFGIKGSRRAFALVIMTAYWWTGFPAVLMLLGMPAALFVFHLSFYTVSLFYRFFHEDDRRTLTLLCIFTPLCFIAHKTAIVTVGLPAAILFACNLRNVDFKKIACLALIGALVLAVNSFWLVPFLHLVKYKVALPEAPHGLNFDPLRIFKDYLTLSKVMGHKILEPSGQTYALVVPNTILRDALLVFGVHGMVVFWRDGRRALSAFFAAFAALFLAEIYFGSFWAPTAELNPTRYVGYLDFMLAVPAAASAGAIWRRLTDPARTDDPERFRRSAARFAKPAFAILFLAALLPFGIFLKQIATPLDKDTLALTDYLKKNTAPGARIMLEDSGWNDRDGKPPKYGMGQFPSMMSDITGREFIGGPYPYVFLSYHYADFHDGKFLGRKIGSYSDREIAESLNRYNIRWIVCWSEDCNNYFLSNPYDFRYLKSIGKFAVFEWVQYKYNPFLAGSGYIIADITGIRCYRVKPENGKVVLKYHWFDGLVIRGGGRLREAKDARYPIGFIEVDDPAPYFTIVNGYWKNSSLR